MTTAEWQEKYGLLRERGDLLKSRNRWQGRAIGAWLIIVANAIRWYLGWGC